MAKEKKTPLELAEEMVEKIIQEERARLIQRILRGESEYRKIYEEIWEAHFIKLDSMRRR